MNKIGFLREGLKNLKTVGTLTRSSPSLCRNIVKNIPFKNAQVLVELGAGDGVITRHLLKHMNEDALLLAFEVNEKFCKRLREIEDERLVVIEDTAEHLPRHLEENGIDRIDQIISAIPFTVIPEETTRNILGLCKKYLREGGSYIQVHYSLLLKKMYKEIFGRVKVHFVPINLPPAFLLECSNGLHR